MYAIDNKCTCIKASSRLSVQTETITLSYAFKPARFVILYRTLLFNVNVNFSKVFISFQVRNSAIRTLFQTLGSHGQKISRSMWDACLWNYVFPILDCVSHLVSCENTCFLQAFNTLQEFKILLSTGSYFIQR